MDSEKNLKTLKDMEHKIKPTNNEWGFKMVKVNELKAEAIKDYKELRNLQKEIVIGDDSFREINRFGRIMIDHSGLRCIMEYIKWKNNLTEEDLK